MAEATQILSAIEVGDPHAAEQLFALVYDQLRKLAAQKLAQERPGQTLQATALVHEAYIRLVGGEKPKPDPGAPGREWNSRGHFFAAAAEAMRRILVENARRKKRVRHGGGLARVDLDHVEACAANTPEHLLALDEALDQLAAEEPVAAEVVKLRYFAGLTIEQAAQVLKVSVRTANRHWAYARAWLFEQLRPTS